VALPAWPVTAVKGPTTAESIRTASFRSPARLALLLHATFLRLASQVDGPAHRLLRWMSTTQASDGHSNPDWARATLRLRSLRRRLVAAAPRPDIVMLGAILWAAGYLVLAVAPGRGLNHPTALSDLWLMPAGVVLAWQALLLLRDRQLASRDLLPWRLIAAGGLLTAICGATSLLSDPPMALIPHEIAGVAALGPLLALGGATALFRRDGNWTSRPRLQYVIDIVAVVLASALALWYFVFEPASGTSAAGDRRSREARTAADRRSRFSGRHGLLPGRNDRHPRFGRDI